MTPVITAFESSPDRGAGQARDFRVRWALEEAGVAYDVRLLSFAAMKQPAHVALQPFGQIPTLEDGAVALFESGAILLHLAERHPALLPADFTARANALSWLFAALGTVEPPIVERDMAELVEADEPWFAARMPLLDERVMQRLGQVAAALGGANWLAGDFSIADIMMVTVLRRLEGSGLIERHPPLAAYVERGKARPAYARAFAAQYAVFAASERG